MRNILFLFVALAGCHPVAFAQITIDVRECRGLSGLVEPMVVGDKVLHFGDSEKAVPAALVTVDCKSKFFLVKAYRSTGGRGELGKLDDSRYLLTGEGTYDIEVTGFDPGIEEKVVQVTLGPPPAPPLPPEPPAPPTPPVPPDAFDNIGQRTAGWTAGLAGRPNVAAVYRKQATALKTDPGQTIDSATQGLTQQLGLVPEYALYTQFMKQVNADLKGRWPMSRGVYADYLACIATGLEAK